MKAVALVIYAAFAIGAVVAMGAISFLDWEPPRHILAMAAFTALLFSANSRYQQAAQRT